MLALLRQRAPPLAARAFAASAPVHNEQAPNPVDSLFNFVHETHEQKAEAAATTQRIRRFEPSAFIHPKELSLKSRTFTRPYRARPLLGPDAATSRHSDLFHQHSIDPSWEYRNAALLSAFESDMAMILPRTQTNLRWRSQRKLRKGIKRAKMFGLLPLWSRPGENSKLRHK